MTSKTTQTESRPLAPLARVLAFVLLLFVTHSATVEVVHSHGDLLPTNAAGAAAFSDSGANQSTSGSRRSQAECLICQLHQHLFSTLLISVPGIAPPQTEEAQARETFNSSPSKAAATRRGRSPPLSSLL